LRRKKFRGNGKKAFFKVRKVAELLSQRPVVLSSTPSREDISHLSLQR